MPTSLDARPIVESLIGSTVFTPSQQKPNRVLDVNGANAIIATESSPTGEAVAIREIQRGLDLLLNEGEVRVTPAAFDNYRRSSAIGAILASLPNTEIVPGSPARVRLIADSPLQAGLEAACEMVTQPRDNPVVTSDDPFHLFMTQVLPESGPLYLGDNPSLIAQGSAGQLNFLWAETPWVAVMNRLVTESAQRGHYLVFLIDGEGRGVYLSLNQGVTEAASSAHGSYRDHLLQHADRLRGYLAEESTEDLVLAPIDLAGDGRRTRGYAMANIAAVHFPAGAIPPDAVLGAQLRRFLRLYETTTTGLDAEQAVASLDIPEEAQTGTESKRYRWHLRAEGRNSAIARLAKKLNGYCCQACGRDFEENLGELGKACIEAHHLVPFADLDNQPRDLDPQEDFAVVCANCHRMLHSQTPPLKIEDLANQLQAGKAEL